MNELVVSSSIIVVLPLRGPWLLSSDVVGSRESPFWWTTVFGIEFPFSKGVPAKIPTIKTKMNTYYDNNYFSSKLKKTVNDKITSLSKLIDYIYN